MTQLDWFHSWIILHTMETLERNGWRVLQAALAIVACVLMVAAFVWAWAKGRQ